LIKENIKFEINILKSFFILNTINVREDRKGGGNEDQEGTQATLTTRHRTKTSKIMPAIYFMMWFLSVTMLLDYENKVHFSNIIIVS
jgi:hypothetical protein